VLRQTVLRGSPRVTDGSPPHGRMSAFVNNLYDDLARNLFTPAPYLRSFSADSAYYVFPNSHSRSEHHPYAGSQTQWSAPNTIRGLEVSTLPRKALEQMALLLGTIPQDPVAQRHKQWFRTILPQCHVLSPLITLTVQKELQRLAVQTGMSAGQLLTTDSVSQVAVIGVLIQTLSLMTMCLNSAILRA